MTARLGQIHIYHVRQKTASFYFCNIFVRTLSITTILAHIYFNKFPIICIFHILYIAETGKQLKF